MRGKGLLPRRAVRFRAALHKPMTGSSPLNGPNTPAHFPNIHQLVAEIGHGGGDAGNANDGGAAEAPVDGAADDDDAAAVAHGGDDMNGANGGAAHGDVDINDANGAMEHEDGYNIHANGTMAAAAGNGGADNVDNGGRGGGVAPQPDEPGAALAAAADDRVAETEAVVALGAHAIIRLNDGTVRKQHFNAAADIKVLGLALVTILFLTN